MTMKDVVINKPVTTLAKILVTYPYWACPRNDGTVPGYLKLRKFLGNDYSLHGSVTVAQIIESNGLDDALQCLQSMPEWDSLWRHFDVDCAERVVRESAHKDTKNALLVARRFAMGLATPEELAEAWVAAARVSAAACEERAGSWAAARSTTSAAGECAAARAAAVLWAAARAASWFAARVIGSEAEVATARKLAFESEREWQKTRLLALCEAGEWTPVSSSATK